MGIDSTARPEDDGTRKLMPTSIQNIRLMKARSPKPPNDCSAECRIVSAISPCSMMTTMPRASPMISATPKRSRAPSTKLPVRPFSPKRAMIPVRIAAPRNRPHICAIHQSCEATPQIMTPKVSAKITRTSDCVPDRTSSVCPASSVRKKRRWAAACLATTDCVGSACTRFA